MPTNDSPCDEEILVVNETSKFQTVILSTSIYVQIKFSIKRLRWPYDRQSQPGGFSLTSFTSAH